MKRSIIALAVMLGLLFSTPRQSGAQIPDKDDTIIHIFGEVTNEGIYAIKSKATLRRAILFAGGITDEAMTRYSIILREPPDGGRRKPITIKTDLNALMDGTAEDIPLVDGDIIIVRRDKTAKSKERKRPI
jgi:protein involved in polysaccharide export with SLBB domain